MFVKVSDGVRLHIKDLGSGPAVVLIAGFGLDHQVWDRQIATLTAAGYRVICIDQRGHGRSDAPLQGYGLTRLVADVEEVVGQLALSDYCLVGHSFGGQVAFGVAANQLSRVDRVVLVSSNGVGAARTERFPFGRAAEELLPALLAGERADRVHSRRAAIAFGFAGVTDELLIDWLLKISLAMPTWAAVACYDTLLASDQVPRLPAVTTPVLQIGGQQDPVVSRRGASWVCSQLPQSRTVFIEGCGHYPMLEAAPEFERHLLDFLREGSLAVDAAQPY